MEQRWDHGVGQEEQACQDGQKREEVHFKMWHHGITPKSLARFILSGQIHTSEVCRFVMFDNRISSDLTR